MLVGMDVRKVRWNDGEGVQFAPEVTISNHFVTKKCHFGSSSKISGDDVEPPGQTEMTVISSLARDDSDGYKDPRSSRDDDLAGD